MFNKFTQKKHSGTQQCTFPHACAVYTVYIQINNNQHSKLYIYTYIFFFFFSRPRQYSGYHIRLCIRGSQGSIPAGIDGFFQSVKILSMTSFGRSVKPWVPCRRFTDVKEPQAEITATEHNLSTFSRSMLKATLMT